ncbi:tetratricopeptide repeat protein [Paracoccus beibuensis]|uniref:tetratricopeptide repeat protein n=1 Tax=Paracoccus beibuensis TaxID=547602 RepID=UPI002240C154|nr:tetratricopeptide repeat protein [Paracoccus beibuensis]
MTADNVTRPARRKGRQAGLRLSVALALGLGLAACKTSEEQAEEYYQSAVDLAQKGDIDRAMVQLRNVFSEEGTHYEARKMLADLHREQGRTSEAYSQYLRLAEQYPDDLPTRIALARLAVETFQQEEFERHAIRAQEIAPDDPDVQAINLAYRYLNVENDEEARQEVVKAAMSLAETRPDDVLLLNILLDQAARDKDLERSGELIDRLITLEPDNPLRYRQRLAWLAERGDKAALEAHLRATIDQFPDDVEAKANLVNFYVSEDRMGDAEAYLRELAEAAPEGDNTARIDLIRFVEMTRGPEAAREEMQKALDAGGDPMVFGTLLAGTDYAAGRRDEAIAAVQALLEERPEPSAERRNVQVQLARMLSGAGRDDEARPIVSQVLAEEAGHVGALKMQAGWDIEADRTDDAILALRAALDHDADDTEALSLMADAYYRAGESDLTRDFLARAAEASGNAPSETLRYARSLLAEGRTRPAEDALLPALQNDNDNVELLSLLGRVYLEMPDMPRAKGVTDRLTEIGSPEAVRAARELEVAQLSQEDGQQAALEYLQDLAAQGEGSIETQLDLLRARLSAGDLDSAQSQLDQLLADQPDNSLVRQAQAALAAARGDAAGARQVLDALIADVPSDPAPHLMRLRLVAQAEGATAAVEAVNASLEQLPDNPDLQWAKASLLEAEGDVDGAIAIFEDLYARQSSSIILANNLASLIATHHADDPERIARATVVAQRLRNTTVPPFMDTYGWLLHLNGDSEAALPYLQGAAEGLPGDAAVQMHLGIVQAALGRVDEAEAQLARGLELAGELQGSTVTAARTTLENLRAPAPDPDAAAAPEGAAAEAASETN